MKVHTLASPEAFMTQPKYLVYYDKYRGGMIYMKTHTKDQTRELLCQTEQFEYITFFHANKNTDALLKAIDICQFHKRWLVGEFNTSKEDPRVFEEQTGKRLYADLEST
jgi:hypothetical protein